MKFFNRKKTNSNLPPEVQAYSQAERRERMGMAWLVGIVSLVVSLLFVTGLFFGGRWAYRQIANRGDKPTPVVTDSNDPQTGNNDQNGQNNGDSSSNGSVNDSADDQPDTIPSTNPPSSGSSSSTSTQTPAQQPVTGDQAVELPSTGPSEDN